MSTESETKPKKKRQKGCLFKTLLTLVVILLVAAVGLFVYALTSARNVVESSYVEKSAEQITIRPADQVVIDKKPFSVLMLGIDTGEYGRVEKGRSDVIMVATVNPNTNKTTITSIPRDTYTEIVGNGTTDKINHAYAFGGTAMSVNTVQNLLEIPIDYTVAIDMGGFEKIVDAVDGINITANATFEINGKSFVEGQEYHLNGHDALLYSRERYVDSDYGRQGRQRQVIEGVVQKATELGSLLSINDIIKSLEGNIQMDINFDEITKILQNYNKAFTNIQNNQLSGEGTMINGVSYQLPDEDSLSAIRTNLKSELELTE